MWIVLFMDGEVMEPDWMGKAPEPGCCDSDCDDCEYKEKDQSDYLHDQRIEREIENEYSK
jgi:hypothetical protein